MLPHIFQITGGNRFFLARFLTLFLAVLVLPLSAEAENPAPVTKDRGFITIRANDLRLENILDQLQDRHFLQFSGISEHLNQQVTLSCTGSAENVVKRLLKALGIRNYAFTFTGERLTQVSILPASDSLETIQKPLARQLESEKKTLSLPSSTVQIKAVLPGTQAERIPLEPLDYILAYNGHRVQNAQGLIAHVKQYANQDWVSLFIVRNKIPMEFILEGGFIGVQVITVPMDSRTLETLYRDSGL